MGLFDDTLKLITLKVQSIREDFHKKVKEELKKEGSKEKK